jgi:hypothetical protein
MLDMCTLGDAADVNPLIKFLRHALQRVTIPATVPQGSEIPEGLMNNPVYRLFFITISNVQNFYSVPK